jgi:hypothetical protein
MIILFAAYWRTLGFSYSSNELAHCIIIVWESRNLGRQRVCEANFRPCREGPATVPQTHPRNHATTFPEVHHRLEVADYVLRKPLEKVTSGS